MQQRLIHRALQASLVYFVIASSLVHWMALNRNIQNVDDKYEHMIAATEGNHMTRCSSNVEEIQLHIFDTSELQPMLQLLQKLQYANYNGYKKQISLYIHINKSLSYLSANSFNWTHGNTVILEFNDHELYEGRCVWLESIGPIAKQSGFNTLMIVLDSSINISPLYFQWLLRAVEAYGCSPEIRDANLFGFSLSSDKAKWNYYSDGKQTPSNLVHLASIPSLSGAAYWSDRLIEFNFFVEVLQSQNLNTTNDINMFLPEEAQLREITGMDRHHKQWINLLTCFMYGKAGVMLYPKSVQTFEFTLDYPDYVKLDVFDANLNIQTRVKLLKKANAFLDKIFNNCNDCKDLLSVWGKHYSDTSRSQRGISCVPDIFMSSSTYRQVKDIQQENEKKYLLYEPQYGANNQIEALVEAYFWAKALKRRLVVPPIFLPRVSEANLNNISNTSSWTNIIDFLSFSWEGNLSANVEANLEPISFQKFIRADARPWRFIQATHHTEFDRNEHVLARAMDLEKLQLVRVDHILGKRLETNELVQLLGGCKDQVLAFDGLFFGNLMGGDRFNVMTDILKLSHTMERLYNDVKKSFDDSLGGTEFACYHVRHGDFSPLCESYRTVYRVRDLETYKCNVPWEEINNMIDSQAQTSAFIMSDERPAIKTNRRFLTSEWVSHTVGKLMREQQWAKNDVELASLLVDQQLCADANIAVLNKFSTTSRRVFFLREGQNVMFFLQENRPKLNLQVSAILSFLIFGMKFFWWPRCFSTNEYLSKKI